ncbi:MAG TPA: cysteine peptidase family C39 domain-containing protein [Haliangiales bacterium]|nr:cysteine peptidase family C39 domain-containing protein [Haliangiales bacterium]
MRALVLTTWLTTWLTTLLVACVPGGSRSFAPATLDRGSDWTVVRGVPDIRQHGEYDCGAAAAAMVLDYWGKPTSEETIWAAAAPQDGHGVRAGWLRDELKRRGLETYLFHGTVTDLYRELAAGRPAIVGVAMDWGNDALTHYLVVVALNVGERTIVALDPARGWRQYEVDTFLREWAREKYLTLAVRGAGVTARASR